MVGPAIGGGHAVVSRVSLLGSLVALARALDDGSLEGRDVENHEGDREERTRSGPGIDTRYCHRWNLQVMASTPASDVSSSVASPELLPVLLPPAVVVGMATGFVAALAVGPVCRRLGAGFSPTAGGAGWRFRSPVVVGAVAFPASLLVVAFWPAVGPEVGPGLAAVLFALAAGVSLPVYRLTVRRPGTDAGRRSPYAYATFVPAWTAVALGCYALVP